MTAASSNLGIQNIGQISIIVHDLERATAFYRDTLGLPLLFTVPNLAFFDCGGVRLMLGPAETPEAGSPELHPVLPGFRYQRRAPPASRARRENRSVTAADCADAKLRPLDDGIPRYGREYHGIDV